MELTVLTYGPSPYQVELFDALVKRNACRLRVIYLKARLPGRLWTTPHPGHDHIFVDNEPSEEQRAIDWIFRADLAVFSNYRDPLARRLMKERSASGRAWCFWAERPGYYWPRLIGRWVRRWQLSPLHRFKAPIWGMGSWAIDGYRQEFGLDRIYCNVPYFSNLDRFGRLPARVRQGGCRFLFSGSLIPRKGVELLATAFSRLALRRPDARLTLLGEGALRRQLERTLANCRPQVDFLGFRQWADLPAIYHSADILCAPSRHDGWGMIVPEGLAAGLPVISTDRMGAALDLIRPRENGWLVPAGRLPPLEAALEEACSLSDAGRIQMAACAAASVGDHTLQAGVRRFLEAADQSLQSWARDVSPSLVSG